MGTTCDAATALEQIAHLGPHVVLLDIGMARMDGLAVTRQIVERFLGIRVVILTTIADHDLVICALQVGASGYILKDMSSDQIAHAVKAAHYGTISLAPQIAQALIHAVYAERQESQAEVEGFMMPGAVNAWVASVSVSGSYACSTWRPGARPTVRSALPSM